MIPGSGDGSPGGDELAHHACRGEHGLGLAAVTMAFIAAQRGHGGKRRTREVAMAGRGIGGKVGIGGKGHWREGRPVWPEVADDAVSVDF